MANPIDVSQLVAFLTRPGAVLISEGLAADYDLKLGDRIELSASGPAVDWVRRRACCGRTTGWRSARSRA